MILKLFKGESITIVDEHNTVVADIGMDAFGDPQFTDVDEKKMALVYIDE